MLPYPLTNFEIQKYYQNESRFFENTIIVSKGSLHKIKDRTYVINLDEYSDIGTSWVALYVGGANDVIYFDSFRVEHIQKKKKKIKAFIGIKSIKTNIFRVQAYDSIMCGYFCIRFIDFKLQGKTLTEFTNLFSPNNFKKKTMI